MPPDACCSITMTMPPEQVPGFASLLQSGMYCFITGPVTIRKFLTGLPGFTEAYIAEAVQTIFHNGVAADNLDERLCAGDTLALSAAMPGLAGAIFRREGAHATLRATITASETAASTSEGFVTLKLYNAIGKDRVVDLLRKGACISGSSLKNFATRRQDLFCPPAGVSQDGRPVAFPNFLETISAYHHVHLTISS